MTPNDDEPDDGSLDAALKAIARVDAPRDFAARVSGALEPRTATPIAGRRARFALAAAAAVLAIVSGLWIASRHAASPSTPVLSSRGTPTAPAHASPASEVEQQLTIPVTAALAVAPVRTTRGTQDHSHSREDDHDRALPALDAQPAVLQPDIAPPSLDTTSIEIDRMNAIAPLTVQGGRDTSGRGDF